MPETDRTPAPTGIILVDKPEGITSHGVVSRLRRALGTRKVGHAGTLDPMATGLLVAGVGPSTRLLTYLVGLDKQYEATIRLGRATTTDDREGEFLGEERSALDLDAERIADAVRELTGVIQQRPSSVSAIKVDGQRSYARVRAGEDVELPVREVIVSEFELLDRREPEHPRGAVDLDVRVTCSSGTYIRALARDLGEALGVGGHLTALRRTRVGPFALDRSHELDAISEAEAPRSLLRGAADIAGLLFPAVSLDADQSRDIVHGKRIPLEHGDAPTVAAVAPDGSLLALLEVRRGSARVVTGFPQDTGVQGGGR